MLQENQLGNRSMNCSVSCGKEKGKVLVDVTGSEPVPPCLQSRWGKTLKALFGGAYTENRRNFRSPIVAKLYRIFVKCSSFSYEFLRANWGPENLFRLIFSHGSECGDKRLRNEDHCIEV